jgi:diguanylate cyclase (GGDEF)-like protein/PAS domain S-box-containing protein/putative nucleotidyltransferase with HDIG domain
MVEYRLVILLRGGEGLVARKRLSIRSVLSLTITISFVLFALLTATFIFPRWVYLSRELIGVKTKAMGEKANDKVSSMVKLPIEINESNTALFERDILDTFSEDGVNLFFLDKLNNTEDYIYSITYGDEKGDYYGSRRIGDKVEIIRNNPSTDHQTWFFTIDWEGRPVEINRSGYYDPRERQWYQVAAAKGSSTFSPVLPNYYIDDLSISVGVPVYGVEGELLGVLASHILLADINQLVAEYGQTYEGELVIVEQESGSLIANSVGSENYSRSQGGDVIRTSIEEMDQEYIKKGYYNYINNGKTSSVIREGRERYSVYVESIEFSGLSWLIISAIPHSPFYDPLFQGMYLQILVTLIIIVLTIVALRGVIRYYLLPLRELSNFSERLATGDFSKRLKVVREDEVGRISRSFNHIADELYGLVTNLEEMVEKRSDEAKQAVARLQVSRERLRLILDTTAEGIYGVNLNGECVFINKSGLRFLGYSKPEELLGRNMHQMICHTDRHGRPNLPEDCKILKALHNNIELHSAEDDIFWRADGSYFDVDYFVRPQVVGDEVTGAVVTFIDNTERRGREAQIAYLSHHDILTGLYNRTYFEQLHPELDKPKNYPISALFIDLNGLKITNDIFGHNAGDELVRKAGEVLEKNRRKGDLLARVGGDEFVMLLPKTDLERARAIAKTITDEFASYSVASLRCNISIGVDTKTDDNQRIEVVLANAENEMYRVKSNSRSAITKETINTILRNIFARSPKEERHAIAVRNLCHEMGIALKLTETEVNKLARVGYYHDIGKATLPDELLIRDEFNPEESIEVQQHAVTGYRILNLFDETLDLAEYVYGHHEQWDGSGHPRGLVGEEIPLISRIIAICESYERALYRGDNTTPQVEKAKEVIRNGAGSRFDPKLSKVFLEMIKVSDTSAKS